MARLPGAPRGVAIVGIYPCGKARNNPPPEAALGSYLEHVTGDDPGKRDSLMKGLDVFLERDRELFDLPHKENPNGKPS